MAFLEDVRLPEDVERGARGGPQFKTSIRTLASGYEKRNKTWENARGKWNVSYGISLKSDLDEVINTFYVVNGQADGFRFKDWSDYQIGENTTPDTSTRQLIGLTDTVATTFQIFKRYTRGANFFDRTITKIVVGSLRVWVNNLEVAEGVGAGDYAIDTTTGIITLGATLAAQSGTEVEVLCDFDVPVRFNQDQFNIVTEASFSIDAVINIPTIEVVEIRI